MGIILRVSLNFDVFFLPKDNKSDWVLCEFSVSLLVHIHSATLTSSWWPWAYKVPGCDRLPKYKYHLQIALVHCVRNWGDQ